ncbi:hypothetical protein V2J09_002777 [Rumex salicifolius]
MTPKKACHQIPPTTGDGDLRVRNNDLSVLNSLPIANWRDSTVANKQRLHASLASHELNHPIHEHDRPALKREEIQLAETVKSISKMMNNLGGDSLEELIMIDTINRLGMDHHFQEEITKILYRHYMEIYVSQLSGIDSCKTSLFEVSLRFRLLRQQGYTVSTHTFDGFLTQDRKFNEELGMDIQSLVSLFEASETRMQGECILDEANAFSRRILNVSMEKLNEPHTSQVQNALKHPFQKSLARFTAHDFLDTLSGAKGWREELQKLAKMDFNAAQILYHKEILHISNWWKKLGLAKELKFARDQPKKWHMWSLAALSDPRMSEQRTEITKAISLIYIIDDIFDVYGTPEELSIFTEAANRWEIETLDMLPHYMKICLKALFDVTEEISHQIWLKYGCKTKDSLQKVWTDLINAFLVESKWFAGGYVPATTEYLNVATVTSGVHVALAHLYFLVGGGSDNYALGKELSNITSSTAMILRLWDDLGNSEDEGQHGHDGSYIKCYINEHEGVSIEDAREHVIDLISDTWKSLNQESMKSPPYSFSPRTVFTKGCFNLARMVPLMYSYDEDHKLPELDKFVTSLLYQSY